MAIVPFSLVGLVVLAIFLIGLAMIIFEVHLGLDKFNTALMMMSSVTVIGLYYWWNGDNPARFQPFIDMQAQTKQSLFALIAFMAFMWMIVEILNERNVFAAMNQALIDRGLNARGMFWMMGLLSALISPFISSLTTTMIFGKAISKISVNQKYTHLVLCNTIISSNSGVWFFGTSTSLMLILANKLTMIDLLQLFPAAIFGWLSSALVLDFFYLQRLDASTLLKSSDERQCMKPGGLSLTLVCIFAIIKAVVLNSVLHVDVEFALGSGLGLIVIYIWFMQSKNDGITLNVDNQLQKVKWATLMYYIGIITCISALNHVGWLSYVNDLYTLLPPVWVNFILGTVSSFIDNNLLEAAAIMANPDLGVEQWKLNALMIGIGGSLTVVGSSAGIMAMTIDKSYTFAAHLRFLPAVLVNFLGSFGFWFVQFKLFHYG
jgi:Na+/H+ antiporter NhaD/arsenite permease-like protein